MSEEKNKAINSLTTALPVTALLAGLAALIFSNSLPYQNERPSIPPLKDSFSAYSQDVDARLWQDPFAAVDGVGKESTKDELSFLDFQSKKFLQVNINKKTLDASSHGRNQIYKDPSFSKAPKSEVTILAVPLSGGPYQEDAEERRRRRYAVLSALANQGYSPLDERHIGYFQPEQKSKSKLVQKKVPFEWWLPLETDKPEIKKKVLVLWVDESSLVWEPAANLKALLVQATKDNSENQFNFNYAVIGPNTSTLLRDMLQEVNRAKSKPEGKSVGELLGEINTKKIVYYSAGATASAESLLKGIESKRKDIGNGRYLHQTITEYLNVDGFMLYRTTATEQEMMKILVDELDLRRIDIKIDHVVILSESDTFYGRAMPNEFKNALKQKIIEKTEDPEKKIIIENTKDYLISYMPQLPEWQLQGMGL